MSDQTEVSAVLAVAAKASKAKKHKVAGVKTPTYWEMIASAITGLKERSGSSRQAIKGYIVGSLNLPYNTLFFLYKNIEKVAQPQCS